MHCILIDPYISSINEEAPVSLLIWTNPPHPLRSRPLTKLFVDFFPRKFAACFKPASRDNHREESYPRTQQRDQGAKIIRNLEKKIKLIKIFVVKQFFHREPY